MFRLQNNLLELARPAALAALAGLRHADAFAQEQEPLNDDSGWSSRSFQHILNPACKHARGPVDAGQIRLHGQY